jgi:hypothetical protein
MRYVLAAGVVCLALVAASSAGARSYPPPFEHAFMSSCTATSGGKTSACRCALRWIERRYTYQKIVSVYMHDQARMRKIMLSAARACMG